MFSTQIQSIESQRQAILAQIEELTRQEEVLVQESLQYQQMEDEALSLLGAIASLKDKFSNHENATSALFAEISKLFQEPPTEPPTEREELRQEHHNQVASEVQMSTDEVESLPQDDGQLDIFSAIESAKATAVDNGQDEPENGYENAEQISEALADTENLDTHLMAIASILDECNAQEIRSRVWFFVQNIPADFDARILGYLPKSIRPEWDKQRTALEVEARASILPPTSETLVVGVSDLVETPTGLVGHIIDVVYNVKQGGRIATVALPNNSTGEFDVATLRYRGKYQAPAPEYKVGDWVELYNGEVAQVTQTKDIDSRIYVDWTLDKKEMFANFFREHKN